MYVLYIWMEHLNAQAAALGSEQAQTIFPQSARAHVDARTADNLCEHFFLRSLTPLCILTLLSFEMKILIQPTQQLEVCTRTVSGD